MSFNIESKDSELSKFLRDIADNIDSKSLDSDKLQKIGEFYMRWNINYSESNNEIEEEDFMKFLTLGMYIYKFVLPKTSSTSSEIAP